MQMGAVESSNWYWCEDSQCYYEWITEDTDNGNGDGTTVNQVQDDSENFFDEETGFNWYWDFDLWDWVQDTSVTLAQ